ncbi:MAG: VWA domain-containing protein [Candidatus Yanofskybacteria bacterium]|nr:VWA domain-containing protein [Candidatus Yanofskybacteria bacterium]
MRKSLKLCVVSVFCFFGLNTFSAEKTVQEPTQFRVEVKNVHLPLLIFDKGQTIKLDKENFRIFEGEKDVNRQIIWTEQGIVSFSRYEDQAIALAVAIDSSESMIPTFQPNAQLEENKLEQAKNAARSLFRSVFREEKDIGLASEIAYEINFLDSDKLEDIFGANIPRNFFFRNTYFSFIKRYGSVTFASTSLFINQDWTDNLKKIEIGISKANQPGGNTPLRDAVFNLAQHFSHVNGDFLRVAVVLTDGLDMPDPQVAGEVKINRHSLAEVINELQNNQVLVYTVGLYQQEPALLFGSNRAVQATDFLEELAKTTGGLAFFEVNLSRLSAVFFKIGAMIRSVNFLSYEPISNTEGERLIKVEAGEWDTHNKWHKKNYTLFHRQGYFYKK